MPVGTFAPAPDAALLEELGQAMREQNRLRIVYIDREGRRTLREIRPTRIYRSRYGATYVQAFCYLKNESRTFRADRIESIEPTAALRIKPSASPRPVPAAPAEQPSTSTTSGPRRGGEGLSAVFGIAATIAVIILAVHLGDSRAETEAALSTPAALAVRTALSQPARGTSVQGYGSQPAGTQSLSTVALVRVVPHRGFAIRDERTLSGERYTVPALGIAAPDLRSAYLAINAALFERRTGIKDARLEAIYGAADTDRNGQLSWTEIESFQLAIYHIFAYRQNDTALRPDEFLDQRGGDCEDWALFTAGLLHFWGWNAEIALFSPPKHGSGHAVVFVRVPEPIPGIGSYTVVPEGKTDWYGLEPGTYVPIDYWDVGGLTSAVGRGWYLEGLRNPEGLYGKAM